MMSNNEFTTDENSSMRLRTGRAAEAADLQWRYETFGPDLGFDLLERTRGTRL
jgi:hypothetical protein